MDHVYDGKQDLTIGFTELFDDGGRRLRGTRDALAPAENDPVALG
jgi:hypothetical protein